MAALLVGDPLEDVCVRLVRSALDAGSSDNVTVRGRRGHRRGRRDDSPLRRRCRRPRRRTG